MGGAWGPKTVGASLLPAPGGSRKLMMVEMTEVTWVCKRASPVGGDELRPRSMVRRRVNTRK